MQTLAVQRVAAASAVVVLVLAGCGADEPAVSTQGEGGVGHSGEVELDRGTVAAQEEAWLAARPAAYSYLVETECDCFTAGTYSVTVDGEEILSVESRDPDAEPHRVYSPPALDNVFSMFDHVDDGIPLAGRTSAAFDPIYGYPTSLTVTGDDGVRAFHSEVRDFMPLDPAAIERPPPGLRLRISNQSFDEPDIGLVIIIDGEVVVERSFAVENQHTVVDYQFPLEPGDHQLIVRADTGAAHEQVVTLSGDRHYVHVNYWGGVPPLSAAFSVSESDDPPLGLG